MPALDLAPALTADYVGPAFATGPATVPLDVTAALQVAGRDLQWWTLGTVFRSTNSFSDPVAVWLSPSGASSEPADGVVLERGPLGTNGFFRWRFGLDPWVADVPSGLP